jgi:hypothetical protein
MLAYLFMFREGEKTEEEGASEFLSDSRGEEYELREDRGKKPKRKKSKHSDSILSSLVGTPERKKVRKKIRVESEVVILNINKEIVEEIPVIEPMQGLL